MTAIITDKFRIALAKDFKENFVEVDNVHYLFIAKSSPWPTVVNPPSSETAPPLPLDTLDLVNAAWDDLLALKKIVDTNVSHVIPHVKWDATSQTVYAPYRSDDANLFHHPTPAEVSALAPLKAGNFFVVTDTYDVYKCLDNNGGSVSTIKPTGVTPGPFTLADGYTWIYMYTVNPADILKFVTDQWIPVKTLAANDGSNQWQAQVNAVDGTVDGCFVVAGGSGYIDTLTGVLTGAGINTVNVSAVGGASNVNNAYVGASVYIEGTGPSANQVRKIISYDGTTKIATLDSNFITVPPSGQPFSILPSINIDVSERDGATLVDPLALFKPVVAGGVITKVLVMNRGAKYRRLLLSVSGCGGTGASVKAAVSPKGGHGSDAIRELGGFYLMLNVKLEYNEGAGDFPLTNDYRRIGILRDPESSPGVLASATTLIGQKSFTLTGVLGTFQPDEVISDSAGNPIPFARVVDYDGVDRLIFFQDETTGFNEFSVGATITGGSSGATGVISAINNAEVVKFSGDLIYIEHRRPIMRAADQIEDIKLIVEF